MGMTSYPVQGTGIKASELDWKHPDGFDGVWEKLDWQYYCGSRNGINVSIDVAVAGDEEEVFLIVYNYRPYQKTPFGTFGELQEFFVEALKGEVNNSEVEIKRLVEDIDLTSWG